MISKYPVKDSQAIKNIKTGIHNYTTYASYNNFHTQSGGDMEEEELMFLIDNDTAVGQIIRDEIKKENDLLNNDSLRFFHVMGEIIFIAQEFHCCLRKLLRMNNIEESNIWGTGKLITESKDKQLFNPREVGIIRKIIELRNWVAHKIFEQEQQKQLTLKSRNNKLAIAKYFLFEAIDFVNDKINKKQGMPGAANVVNDNCKSKTE